MLAILALLALIGVAAIIAGLLIKGLLWLLIFGAIVLIVTILLAFRQSAHRGAP